LAVPPKGTAFFMHEHEAFLNYLRVERRYSPHTINGYRIDLEQCRSYLSAQYELQSWPEASTAMLRSWMVSLIDAGLSPKSVQRKRSSLSSLYRYLIREGVIARDPVARTRIPKSGKRLPSYVEQPAMALLIDARPWGSDFSAVRDKLMLVLLYETGMRLAELIGLQTIAIDRQKKALSVVGKRNKERVIPLIGDTLGLIEEYLELRAKTFEHTVPELLVTDKGVKLYPKFVYRKVNAYLGRVTTLAKKSPHILRHTFATHMLNNGAQLNTVKELLGHANLAATQVYTHNTIEKLKRVHALNHPKG